MGVAYVDFKTQGEAQRAKEGVNGQIVNGRALKIKQFVPYNPSKAIKRGASKTYKKPQSDLNEISETPDNAEEHIDPLSAVPETIELSDEQASPIEDSIQPAVSPLSLSDKPTLPQKLYSSDTVFIKEIHPTITDGDLREYFHNYGPTAVFIFKSYNQHRRFRFRTRYVSALVTLSAEDGLTKALKELKSVKLNGKPVKLDAAFKQKVEEVANAARALEMRSKEIEGQAQQVAAVASQAAATEGTVASSTGGIEETTESNHNVAETPVGDNDSENCQNAEFDDAEVDPLAQDEAQNDEYQSV